MRAASMRKATRWLALRARWAVDCATSGVRSCEWTVQGTRRRPSPSSLSATAVCSTEVGGVAYSASPTRARARRRGTRKFLSSECIASLWAALANDRRAPLFCTPFGERFAAFRGTHGDHRLHLNLTPFKAVVTLAHTALGFLPEARDRACRIPGHHPTGLSHPSHA